MIKVQPGTLGPQSLNHYNNIDGEHTTLSDKVKIMLHASRYRSRCLVTLVSSYLTPLGRGRFHACDPDNEAEREP